MRRRIAVLCAIISLLGFENTHAQSAPPGTEVYLAPLERAHNGNQIGIGEPQDITRRPGYDNQPAFMGDERAVYYTSVRHDGQADIYRYDIAAHSTTRITATPESEYSATYMPAARFSVVRVEPDSTQRLWSFAINGTDPRLVIRSVKPVGYHAWLDPNHVAAYVLGTPATLQVVELPGEHVDTVARDIGRSLATVGRGIVSFVQPRAGGGFTLHEVQLDRSGRPHVRSLVALPDSAEYVVWLNGGAALTASGSTIYLLKPGTTTWTKVADFSDKRIHDITRLALSPNGHWLAFVADDGVLQDRVDRP